MEPILSLPPAQFRAALAELNLPRDRADALRRQYRLQNSPLAGLYGLLDRAAQGEDGMEAATFLPVSRPEGMSVADAIRSGEAGIAVPQGLLDAVGGVARALDAPSAAAAGLIPREDMIGEALNVAGAAQLGGAAMPAPRGALRSAALGTADEVMESPAQRVARLLRNGRADEVTDDLMAQVDPQEMFRLYVAGETGMDLPMDEASRMARASELGFDTAVYHGGTSDIRALSPFEGGAEGGQGVLFSSDEARVANTYAPRRAQPMGENVTPLIARSGGYREAGYTRPFPADGSDAEIENWLAGLEQFDRRMSQPGVKSNVFSQQIEAARANNQPGVVFRQVVDDRIDTGTALPSDVFATIDPTTIRSRFARFDPRLSHLADLNAANIDPLTGAAAMGASQQQQDPLASLRAYLAATGGVLGR